MLRCCHLFNARLRFEGETMTGEDEMMLDLTYGGILGTLF